MLRIEVLTLFPRMFDGVLGESIIKRALQKKLIRVAIHNLRNWSKDKHRKVDDKPYGGGPGMILQCQPICDAVGSLRKKAKSAKVVLLSPQGRKLNQQLSEKLAKQKSIILICGHYEGVDARVGQIAATEEVSIGDYVLTGGELPAMVLIDTVVRNVPGVLGNKKSIDRESFVNGLLEYPQYTRPRVYKGKKVPDILLTGNHKQIEKWRYEEALKKTRKAGL